MSDPVFVQIPVSPEVARMLTDERAREEAGAEIERLLLAQAAQSRLLDVIRAIQAEVVASGGISNAELETELAAHKAERRH